MSFDGLFTRGMVKELQTNLSGGRINKIHQPSKNELLFVIRANGQNRRLLLSSHSSYARAQLTEEKIDNPNEATMFCMLLRKHLEGFTIEDITQVGLERIITFHIRGRNEIGDLTSKQLIVEIMGKHSNIILVDPVRGMILDCIKHVSPVVNRVRTLLPGHTYQAPPAQDKRNPLSVSADEINVIHFTDIGAAKTLVTEFAGLSPFITRALLSAEDFVQYMDLAKRHQYQPTMMVSSEQKESFYLWPLAISSVEVKTFPSLSELLDRFYFGKAGRDRNKQQAADLIKLIQNELDKNQHKLSKLANQLIDAKNADIYKKTGELLTANLHLLSKGMKTATVQDYYHPDLIDVSIPLDPRKAPNANAQHYFAKYQKAKKSIQHIHEQSALAKVEIDYLENILHQLETVGVGDIEEIRSELEEQKYVRVRERKNKKKKPKPKNPVLEEYTASDGTEILVGKNNLQNEYLTMRLAGKNNLWFHVKDIPGSHVVIRSDAPSEAATLEAAQLAAYFSKASESSNVAVDYTLIKHVKKPSGAKPGYVTYDHQQTTYVTPSEDQVLTLRHNGR